MKKIVILIILNLAACSLMPAQSRVNALDKAKQIKLLESGRDEVQKIFAGYDLEPSDASRYYQRFSSGNAHIWVSYSSGNCAEYSDDWNMPAWTVTKVNIEFEIPIKPKSSGINLSKYKKEKVYANVSDQYMYHDQELEIGIEVRRHKIKEITLTPSKKYSHLLCNAEEAKKRRSRSSWYTTDLKERLHFYETPNLPADVVNLILSIPEITADCTLPGAARHCADGVKMIAVFSAAKDPDGDVLIYSYEVSGGIITGRGEKVLWDLSGVKAGTYTIKASVDDGCGFCGKSISKTVVVKECPDCH